MRKINAETYWYGDLAEYTGRANEAHGKTFYEIRLIEGYLAGQVKWTNRSPDKGITRLDKKDDITPEDIEETRYDKVNP